MQELLRTNDIVKLSWLQALLADAGIACFVADGHMSIMEGSIGILPRRLMVPSEDHAAAARLVREAGDPPPFSEDDQGPWSRS